MAWRIKVVDDVWLTLDSSISHTAVFIDDIVTQGTTTEHRGPTSGDLTKQEGFKIHLRSGQTIFFPCRDAKYALYCARRISRITYA